MMYITLWTKTGIKKVRSVSGRGRSKQQKLDNLIFQNTFITRQDLLQCGFSRNISRILPSCEKRTDTQILPVGVDKWEVIHLYKL